MNDIELNAQRVAKVIRINAETLATAYQRGGAQAVGDAIGNTPVIQYIAAQMSEDEYAHVLRRALQIVGGK